MRPKFSESQLVLWSLSLFSYTGEIQETKIFLSVIDAPELKTQLVLQSLSPFSYMGESQKVNNFKVSTSALEPESIFKCVVPKDVTTRLM